MTEWRANPDFGYGSRRGRSGPRARRAAAEARLDAGAPLKAARIGDGTAGVWNRCDGDEVMVDGVDRGVLRGKKVLVVEDEALIAMLFEDILADLDCEVVGPAMNVRQGLELAGEASIDLAVLDLNLAGESSFPVADVLKGRGVPVVFSSGYGSSGLPPEWQGAPTLPKPFTSDEVADTLSRVAAGA